MRPIDRAALFSPAHEAATKLSIAATDLDEAALHLENAIKHLREGVALTPSSASPAVMVAARALQASIGDLRHRMRRAAAKLYPKAYGEEPR